MHRSVGATLVAQPEDVDHESGCFLKIQQDEVESYLHTGVTCVIFLREYLFPLRFVV